MFVVNNLLFPAGCCIITPDSPVNRYQLLTPQTCKGLNTPQVSGHALWFNQQHCAAILSSSSLCTAISSSFPKRREERIHQLQLVLQQSLENKHRPHQSFVSALSFSRENCLWPTSSSRKQLRFFLEFANFLQDYRKVVSPPTSLISHSQAFPVVWGGQGSIQMSEVPFHPRPAWVSTFLSQWDPTDQRLHTCVLFNWRLAPAKVNYHVFWPFRTGDPASPSPTNQDLKMETRCLVLSVLSQPFLPRTWSHPASFLHCRCCLFTGQEEGLKGAVDWTESTRSEQIFFCPNWNTPMIHWCQPPAGCPLLWPALGISLLYLISRRMRGWGLMWRLINGTAEVMPGSEAGQLVQDSNSILLARLKGVVVLNGPSSPNEFSTAYTVRHILDVL